MAEWLAATAILAAWASGGVLGWLLCRRWGARPDPDDWWERDDLNTSDATWVFHVSGDGQCTYTTQLGNHFERVTVADWAAGGDGNA